MNCEKVKEHLSLYMDDMLNDDIAENINVHLQSCANCSKYYKMLFETKAALTGLPDIPLPDGFNAKLHEALLAESKWIKGKSPIGYVKSENNPTKKPPILTLKQLSGIAAAILLIFTGTAMYQQGFISDMVDYIIDVTILKDAENVKLPDTASSYSASDGGDKALDNTLDNAYDYSFGTLQDSTAFAGFSNQVEKDMEKASAYDESQKKQSDQEHTNDEPPEQVARGDVGEAFISSDLDSAAENAAENGNTNRQKADEKVRSLVTALNASAYLKTDPGVNKDAYMSVFDLGTLYYSLAEHRKEDEHTDVFVYNIGGTKNGDSASHQITILVIDGVVKLQDTFAE